ncbi:MAG: class I SAM-dependent methyltransferase [Polyangiaceae bacterium]
MTKIVSPREFFGAIARRYDREYAPPSDQSKAKMARVLSHLPTEKSRVLDLGVGTGRELPALLDAGHEVVGVDIAEPMIELAKKRARPIEIVLADFWSPPLPFADARFDAVLALHGTLAHPPDDALLAMSNLATELARILRPLGVVLLEVPSPAFIEAIRAQPSPVARELASDRSIHEDVALGVAIEARAFAPERWIEAFCRHFEVSVETISDVEQLVVGRLVG